MIKETSTYLVTVLQCENYQVLKKGPQGCTVHSRCSKREMKINWSESTLTLQVVQLVPRAGRGKNIFWIPLTELQAETHVQKVKSDCKANTRPEALLASCELSCWQSLVSQRRHLNLEAANPLSTSQLLFFLPSFFPSSISSFAVFYPICSQKNWFYQKPLQQPG